MHDLTQCLDAVKYFADIRSEPVFEAVLGKWPQIVEMVKILEIPYITTKYVQDPNFTLSDFYGCWLKMTIGLENLIKDQNDRSGLAQAILTSLLNRKKQLLEHPAMICAVFLDPRFHYELNENEKNFARLNLKKIWCRLAQFKNRADGTNQNINNNLPQDDPLEQYFAGRSQPALDVSKNNSNKSDEPNFCMGVNDFMNQVEKYGSQLPRLHHSTSILDYWLKKNDNSLHIKDFVELQFVATTVLAIPSTQTPCERNFSDLNFVYGCRRTKLDTKILECILFIRTNRKLFEEVTKQDLKSCSYENR